MFLFRKPSSKKIREFLAAQVRLDLTYAAVGATATVPPPGYVVNHTRIELGTGEKVFRAAKTALGRWEQFRLGWLEASPDDTPIKEGQVVAIMARSLGLWWLNACRIVTVVDEEHRFGFAYGTLSEQTHSFLGMECGTMKKRTTGMIVLMMLAVGILRTRNLLTSPFDLSGTAFFR